MSGNNKFMGKSFITLFYLFIGITNEFLGDVTTILCEIRALICSNLVVGQTDRDHILGIGKW